MRNDVPRGKPYTTNGNPPPSVGFNSDPHPEYVGCEPGCIKTTVPAASTLNPRAVARTAPQYGTPSPNTSPYGVPTMAQVRWPGHEQRIEPVITISTLSPNSSSARSPDFGLRPTRISMTRAALERVPFYPARRPALPGDKQASRSVHSRFLGAAGRGNAGDCGPPVSRSGECRFGLPRNRASARSTHIGRHPLGKNRKGSPPALGPVSEGAALRNTGPSSRCPSRPRPTPLQSPAPPAQPSRPPKTSGLTGSRSADKSGRVSAVEPKYEGGPRGRHPLRLRAPGRLPAGHFFLQLFPQSGRTHQLRIQAARRGSPIMGDTTYGSSQPFDCPDRIALHARSLTIKHPVSGQELTLVAPVPAWWS